MDIIEIKHLYFDNHYTAAMPDVPAKLAPDYVFDENLSVKHNREMVAEHNQRVDQLKKAARESQADLSKKLKNDVVEYITESYNLTRKQAELVEFFAYDKGHHAMTHYFDLVDEFADFADDIINCSEEE